MNKSVNTVLVLIFSSLGMGLYAQCDSMKSFDLERATEVNISLDPKDYPPTADDPTNPPPPPNPEEVRRIYFIHGLGGDKKAWSKAAQACQDSSLKINGFPARKCETIRNDYVNSTSSLYLAADDIRTAISLQADADRSKGKLAPSRAIIIAHSQGGVVTRELMHLDMVQEKSHSSLTNGMNYGGVVTVASPLQGAAILKNRDYIFTWVNSGCDILTDGFEVETRSKITRRIPDVFNLKENADDWLKEIFNNITETVCKVATDDIMPMFFKDYYDGITNSFTTDYSDTGNLINMLNSDTNCTTYKNFPKVAFYAVEPQTNIFWRTLNWMYYDPNGNNGQKGPKVEHFEANDDWRLYDSLIKPIIDFYQAKEAHYWFQYDMTCQLINLGAKCKENTAAKNMYYENWYAWQGGSNWLRTVNTTWQTIIGASYSKNGGVTRGIKENDGVVLAESAAKLPYAQSVVRIYPNENSTVDFEKGSSHMQVRNDRGLKTHLKALFDGDYYYWFYTAEQ